MGAPTDVYVCMSSFPFFFLVGLRVAPQGDSFGELALMYDAPRAVTVVANKPGGARCWAIDRVTFKRILMDSATKKRDLHLGFLRDVPILSTLERYERMTVADALQSRVVDAGEVILREGSDDVNDGFFIIERGEVKCTQAGAGEVSKRLTRGDYFGERALLKGCPRAATVTAVADNTKILSLTKETFQRLLGPLQDILTRNMTIYEHYVNQEEGEATAEEFEGKE